MTDLLLREQLATLYLDRQYGDSGPLDRRTTGIAEICREEADLQITKFAAWLRSEAAELRRQAEETRNDYTWRRGTVEADALAECARKLTEDGGT